MPTTLSPSGKHEPLLNQDLARRRNLLGPDPLQHHRQPPGHCYMPLAAVRARGAVLLLGMAALVGGQGDMDQRRVQAGYPGSPWGGVGMSAFCWGLLASARDSWRVGAGVPGLIYVDPAAPGGPKPLVWR